MGACQTDKSCFESISIRFGGRRRRKRCTRRSRPVHLQLNWYPLSGSNYAPNPCFRPPERVWDRPNSPAWGGLDLHPSRLGMKGAQMGEVRSAALRRLMLPHMARRVARTGAVLGGNDAELNDLVAALESEDEERAAATERHDKKPAAMQFAWPMLASCLLLRVRSIPADQYATKRRFARAPRVSPDNLARSAQSPVNTPSKSAHVARNGAQTRLCARRRLPTSTSLPTPLPSPRSYRSSQSIPLMAVETSVTLIGTRYLRRCARLARSTAAS